MTDRSAIERLIDDAELNGLPNVDEARAELTRLLEFADHKPECDAYLDDEHKALGDDFVPSECTCGFSEFRERFADFIARFGRKE